MRNVVISNPELNQHMLRTNGGGAFPTFAFHSAKGCVDVNGNSSWTVPLYTVGSIVSQGRLPNSEVQISS